MSQVYDGAPSAAELEQDEAPEYPHPPIAVSVDGVVRVQELPARLSGMQTHSIGTAATATVNGAKRLFGADPRRRSVTLFAFDEEIRLGRSEAQVESDQSVRWPKLVPLTVPGFDELWIAAAQNVTAVSVVSEQWSD